MSKNKKDTCNIKVLEKVKLKNLDYLLKKYHEGEDFKYHVFEKIFIVDKISKDKLIKYEVYWSGEWTIK